MSDFLCRMLSLVGLLFIFSAAVAEPHKSVNDITPDFRGVARKANPTVRDLRAQGQLGGPLHPTRSAKQALLSPDEALEQNLAFGKAMTLWNTHRYKEATALFREYTERFPQGTWEGEAILHMGCEARFNGRFSEADNAFTKLLEQYLSSEDADSRMIAEKAKSRLAELRIVQNNREQAKALFSELTENAEDWRHRTYASHWLQRLSREA